MVGAAAADHHSSPHAGIWRDVDRDNITEIIKVKAHLSQGQAAASGHGVHWRGNFRVDLLAKETAKRNAVTESQEKAFMRSDLHETRVLRQAAVALAGWPVPPPELKQLQRARRGPGGGSAGGGPQTPVRLA